MKIATYHKMLGDEIIFCKGNDPQLNNKKWDNIYITTLFTFYWNTTIKTIKFYSKNGNNPIVGGILASLMPKEIEKETGVKPHIGPLYELDNRVAHHFSSDNDLTESINEHGIDALPPDYSIFEGKELPYSKFLNDSYYLRTTRGCKRGCSFCSVKDLEPKFVNRIKLTPIIRYVNKFFREKCNLTLLDDNLLLSNDFDLIIDEIKDLGFENGSTFKRRKRKVDYNQGLDIRLLKKNYLKKLSTISLRPLRLAFDDIKLERLYKEKLNWAMDFGFKEISSYILFNFKDTPSDFYQRIIIASNFNESNGCRIYTFPMKYAPCNAKNRRNVGAKWNKRKIRGVQCILNATHGIVPTKTDFVRRAFGESEDEYLRIIQMPENYIIYRSKYIDNGMIDEWNRVYNSLTSEDREQALLLISGGKGTIKSIKSNKNIKEFLDHYKDELI